MMVIIETDASIEDSSVIEAVVEAVIVAVIEAGIHAVSIIMPDRSPVCNSVNTPSHRL
jgi:hypothetical protein